MWLTDSTNLTAFLEKGSIKPDIQKDVLKVYKLARKHNIVLWPVHLLREDPRIVMADAGSKWNDTDDWAIDAVAFEEISQLAKYPMEVDLFADTKNAKFPHFYSKYKCPNSRGTNAFATPWTRMKAWVCPPTGKIVETIKKIGRSTDMTGILIIPVWRTAVFWPFVSPDGVHVNECFEGVRSFRPYILQGETNSGNNLLKGFTAFSFLALIIRSRGTSGTNKAGGVKLPPDV